jgi:hypothetical protein
MPTAAAQLSGFLAKYTPPVRAVAKAALATMRKRMPGAQELVYDNSYALVIGFGPNERPSDALFSIVLYPRHVTLCFLQGALLDDPQKILQGSGNQVRHIRLIPDASVLDRPEVRSLIQQAITTSDVPLESARGRKLVIRSVSAKQRSRRPPTRGRRVSRRLARRPPGRVRHDECHAR